MIHTHRCRNGYHGLWRQLKPWVRLPAPLQKLSRATNASGGQELALYEGVNARNTLSRKYTRQIIQEGQGVCEPLPVAPYDPFAIQRRDAIRAIGVSNAILMADACIPMTLTDQSDLAAWNSRCLAVRQYRLAAIQRVQQILTPSSSISPSMKTIMAYMAKNVRRMSDHLPHITWNREMWQAKVATQVRSSHIKNDLRSTHGFFCFLCLLGTGFVFSQDASRSPGCALASTHCIPDSPLADCPSWSHGLLQDRRRCGYSH